MEDEEIKEINKLIFNIKEKTKQEYNTVDAGNTIIELKDKIYDIIFEIEKLQIYFIDLEQYKSKYE